MHDYSQGMTIRGGNVIQETERRLCGVVKWFDPSKGFGFIVADGTQDDILLHANVLRNFGQSSVADNARIEFIAQGFAGNCCVVDSATRNNFSITCRS